MSKKEIKPPALEFFDTKPVELDPTPEDPAIAVLNRIAEFEDTLPDRFYEWHAGAPAPEWMGPRPAWAEDYYDNAKDFRPSECFWQSPEIRIPVVGLYGAKIDNGAMRSMGGYEVFLRQHVGHREPDVIIRMGPKSNEYHLGLTLSEVGDLVAAVEMLADIAKAGMADEPVGGGGGD